MSLQVMLGCRRQVWEYWLAFLGRLCVQTATGVEALCLCSTQHDVQCSVHGLVVHTVMQHHVVPAVTQCCLKVTSNFMHMCSHTVACDSIVMNVILA
jgi:hypothetical protein